MGKERRQCDVCNGSGRISDPKACPSCKGCGWVTRESSEDEMVECTKCEGKGVLTGWPYVQKCECCRGSGYTWEWT